MGITDPLHQRRLSGWLKALQPRYDVSRRADEFVQCVVSFQRQKVTARVTAFTLKSENYQDFGLQMVKLN